MSASDADTAADSAAAARFPLLFAPQRWEWGGLDARFSTAPPPPELVTNIHVIGYCDGGVVLCRTERDRWFLPGGTRERDESIEDCAARELLEEAGAQITGPLRWIGAHYSVTDLPEPYRPWQPHPEKAWLWCAADVTLVSQPTNPPDGEQVVEVRVATLDEAEELMRQRDGGWSWLAELLALARSQDTETAQAPRSE
jgi:8-oxo-dGTP diphosphatase